ELDSLVVDEEHPAGYDPTLFGGFKDADKNGCNTRDEVLIAQSTEPVRRNGRCNVVSGSWTSPYDGLVVTKPDDVAIDHVVTIREAWESGAWHWTDEQRNVYVNDLKNAFSLHAVSMAVKTAKADKEPQEWLPPNESYVCEYISDWIHVKSAWKLT